MSPAKSTADTLPSDLRQEAAAFAEDVARGRLSGSLPLSLATVKLAKRLIGQAPWQDAQDLMSVLRRHLAGPAVDRDDPAEAVVGNLTRRVLKLVREEHAGALAGGTAEGGQHEQEGSGSLHGLLVSGGDGDDEKSLRRKVPGLKAKVLESIDELESEIEAAAEEISNQALEHIHANEVILTVGRSRTVELFLKQAARERKFQVIVAEAGPPGYQGQRLATSLARAGVAVTLITDSAVFALMSRVNKVIVGTAAILADGGLKAPAGTLTAALSARHHSVPLYVCASITKLTPVYNVCTAGGDPGSFNRFESPEGPLAGMDGPVLAAVAAPAPVYEYVPPDLVTLFISNLSGHAPSYVYRLLSELYHPKDYDLTT